MNNDQEGTRILFTLWKENNELRRQNKGLKLELNEIEQELGKVLGYPWYKDDQENFPGATEADGVCVGDMVPVVLAEVAAKQIRTHEEAIKELSALILEMRNAATKLIDKVKSL